MKKVLALLTLLLLSSIVTAEEGRVTNVVKEVTQDDSPTASTADEKNDDLKEPQDEVQDVWDDLRDLQNSIPLWAQHKIWKRRSSVEHKGCCKRITVTLSDDAKEEQGACGGIYTLRGSINGRPYWFNSKHSRAIWYIPEYKDWTVGSATSLGSKRRRLSSAGDHMTRCPDDKRNRWRYWSGEKWITKNVVVKCHSNPCKVNNGGCTQICVQTTPGVHECRCTRGYQLQSDRKTCKDINECNIRNGGCSQQCVNKPGSFECRCKTGYRLLSDTKTCSDVNECENKNGGCGHTCVNKPGSFECRCKKGYELDRNRRTCSDVDECEIDNGGCDHDCFNKDGSFECKCREGYFLKKDGKHCQDINECTSQNGGCDHSCVNTKGSYKCACRHGYKLQADKKTCADINECLVSNGGCSQLCINKHGSHECRCRPGYTLLPNKKECTDIKECAVNNGGCSQVCLDTIGSFECGCWAGFAIQPDEKSCVVSPKAILGSWAVSYKHGWRTQYSITRKGSGPLHVHLLSCNWKGCNTIRDAILKPSTSSKYPYSKGWFESEAFHESNVKIFVKKDSQGNRVVHINQVTSLLYKGKGVELPEKGRRLIHHAKRLQKHPHLKYHKHSIEKHSILTKNQKQRSVNHLIQGRKEVFQMNQYQTKLMQMKHEIDAQFQLLKHLYFKRRDETNTQNQQDQEKQKTADPRLKPSKRRSPSFGSPTIVRKQGQGGITIKQIGGNIEIYNSQQQRRNYQRNTLKKDYKDMKHLVQSSQRSAQDRQMFWLEKVGKMYQNVEKQIQRQQLEILHLRREQLRQKQQQKEVQIKILDALQKIALQSSKGRQTKLHHKKLQQKAQHRKLKVLELEQEPHKDPPRHTKMRGQQESQKVEKQGVHEEEKKTLKYEETKKRPDEQEIEEEPEEEGPELIEQEEQRTGRNEEIEEENEKEPGEEEPDQEIEQEEQETGETEQQEEENEEELEKEEGPELHVEQEKEGH